MKQVNDETIIASGELEVQICFTINNLNISDNLLIEINYQ